MGRPLVPQDRPTRLPAPAGQRRRWQQVGLLSGLPDRRQGPGGGDATEPAGRRVRRRLHLRPQRGPGDLAGGARGGRVPARRPDGPALGLLPDGLRPVHGVHRGPLPDRGGCQPVRPLAPILADRGPVRLPGGTHPQHGRGRRARRGRERTGGRLARPLPPPGRRRGRGPARARGVHGLQLGHGGDPRRLPHLRALLAGPALRLVHDPAEGVDRGPAPWALAG